MIHSIKKILRKNFKSGDDAIYLAVKVDGKEICRIYDDMKRAEILIGTDNDSSSIVKELRTYLEDKGYSISLPAGNQ